MKTEVVTVRIPRELKESMRKIDINWSEEIRRFIEEKVRSYELLETVSKVRARARSRKVKVDSVKLIREAREER